MFEFALKTFTWEAISALSGIAIAVIGFMIGRGLRRRELRAQKYALIGEYRREIMAFSKEFFEQVAEGRDGKAAANWVINELMGALNKAGKGIDETPVTPQQLGAIVDLIGEGTISGKIAKELFEIVWSEGGDPRAIVEDRGMKQVTDTGAIEQAVDEVIAANPDKAEQARAKPSMAGWFVGQVMKATGGKANPKAVNDLVKAKLGIEE